MNTYVLIMFALALISFVIVLVRHIMLLRVLTITLRGIEDNHRLFSEALEIERERQRATTIAPE